MCVCSVAHLNTHSHSHFQVLRGRRAHISLVSEYTLPPVTVSFSADRTNACALVIKAAVTGFSSDASPPSLSLSLSLTLFSRRPFLISQLYLVAKSLEALQCSTRTWRTWRGTDVMWTEGLSDKRLRELQINPCQSTFFFFFLKRWSLWIMIKIVHIDAIASMKRHQTLRQIQHIKKHEHRQFYQII